MVADLTEMSFAHSQGCLADYHAELVRVRPEAAETYPLDVLVRDVAVGFNLFFLCIAVPVAIGVVGAELPPDKAEFTWKSCASQSPLRRCSASPATLPHAGSYFSQVWRNWIHEYLVFDPIPLSRKVLAGEYE